MRVGRYETLMKFDQRLLPGIIVIMIHVPNRPAPVISLDPMISPLGKQEKPNAM